MSEEKQKKIDTEKQVMPVLKQLDRLYGTTKTGFFHQEPWQLLVAIMLSAQSTDKQVEEVLPELYRNYPKVEHMANAPVEEIERNIRSIGLYKSKAKNIKKCCGQIVTEYAGQVPETIGELLRLAGVGRKTADTVPGGCPRDSRRDGGHPCIQNFPPFRVGFGEESRAG